MLSYWPFVGRGDRFISWSFVRGPASPVQHILFVMTPEIFGVKKKSHVFLEFSLYHH